MARKHVVLIDNDGPYCAVIFVFNELDSWLRLDAEDGPGSSEIDSLEIK